MNTELKTEMNRRIAQTKERLRFNMCLEIIDHGNNGVNIVKLKKYIGVENHGKLTINPAFDEIRLSSDRQMAFCKIGGFWHLYSSETGEELMTESFSEPPIFHEYYDTLEIISDNMCRGLYDMRNHRILLKAEYEDVGICAAFSHIWVRKHGDWGFVDKKTGKEWLVEGLDMAYDAEEALLVRKGDTVLCINSNGHSDPETLRRFVVRHKGRGTARNTKYHETVIFDVYGHILN